MNLRAPHFGYAYQDLLTGIALVDLVLGTARAIVVDTKNFEGDMFDDVGIHYADGRRLRLQIKHTTSERALVTSTFSADGRGLRLDKLFAAVLHDVAEAPTSQYRVVLRERDLEPAVAAVLEPLGDAEDPGEALRGLTSVRHRFKPENLRTTSPWSGLVVHLTDDQLRVVSRHLTVDTYAPSATLSLVEPGPAERILLRRVTEELGAGRVPNQHIAPEHVARALIGAATTARAVDGQLPRERVLPEVGLTTDFGAVAAGSPVEDGVSVSRTAVLESFSPRIKELADTGGRVVLTGEPGTGKSWLSQQLAATYGDGGWIVARHHCWLGSTDIDRDQRVLSDVVIGSLIHQLEEAVPGATTELRPRFEVTAAALAEVVARCRLLEPERDLMLVVDGLDHVDRVAGQVALGRSDPARVLVETLASVDLGPGAVLLIASQPGEHLGPVEGSLTLSMPNLTRDETESLMERHQVFAEVVDEDPHRRRRVVELVHDRSRGNVLYATYLCRYVTQASVLDHEARSQTTLNQLRHRLTLVPATATDIHGYYDYLLDGMTADQEQAVAVIALCEFAISETELGELIPAVRPWLKDTLSKLAPVLNSQPGLGGIRTHHESFSRRILHDRDEAWIAWVRSAIAEWLKTKDFFVDSRAFRHLPRLLLQLERHEELRALADSGFVQQAIHAFQPPSAVAAVLRAVADSSAKQFDWTGLVACIELRKALDTYESEALPESITAFGEVVVGILGASNVAERLLYEGRPTLPSRWGLRLCDVVDRAGAAAPWMAYIDARERDEDHETTTYSSDRDGTLQLAIQRGWLRLRHQRNDYPKTFVDEVARHLELDHQATLTDLVEVFAATTPPGVMAQVAASMSDDAKAAEVYLRLAHLSARGDSGLPPREALAREAWNRDPDLDVVGFLEHGISAAELAGGRSSTTLADELAQLTATVTQPRGDRPELLRRWLGLLTLVHSLNRPALIALTTHLAGDGFYRAWLRYAVSTVGIARDVSEGVVSRDAASTAVLVALKELASHAQPFTGKPRACDLYSLHPVIHEVLERSLVVVLPSDLDSVLDQLIAIGDGTTTITNLGIGASGPLTTNDLLELLSRVSSEIGVEAVHSLLRVVRERRNEDHAAYANSAEFELSAARISLAAGAADEAAECWSRASVLFACYGGHKDPTLSELTTGVQDLRLVDMAVAREALVGLLELTYLVRQHTDGRDTSHYVRDWWKALASLDPLAAAQESAGLLLADPGFDDLRASAAHSELLERFVTTADPFCISALRMTVGTEWRHPDVDLELLRRLGDHIDERGPVDAQKTVIANQIASSYDEQALMYSSDQPTSSITPQLVDAVVALGGCEVEARKPRPPESYNRSWPTSTDADSDKLRARLFGLQRPMLPAGNLGAVMAARELELKDYSDDPEAPRWDIQAASSAIGWRVLDAALESGEQAARTLIDQVAAELTRSSPNNELLAIVGEGLAVRCPDAVPDLARVASYCLTLAYVRIRGSGGWREFAGRERVSLWAAAHALAPDVAEATLASCVADCVNADAYRTFGVTQALIAAFAESPPVGVPDAAAQCWDRAFLIIQKRLPGRAVGVGHSYRPTQGTPTSESLETAIATLAIATIATAQRALIRQSLVACSMLLVCRSEIAQRALANVLGRPLDASRLVWILECAHSTLAPGELTSELEFSLESLLASDLLAVRTLAARILERHGREVASPVVTDPRPELLSALRNQGWSPA